MLDTDESYLAAYWAVSSQKRTVSLVYSNALHGAHSFVLLEFAVLESLLNLFARLLPSSSSSQKKYEVFIDQVYSKNFDQYKNCGSRVIELLHHAPRNDWEETATRIIDIFAKADITL